MPVELSVVLDSPIRICSFSISGRSGGYVADDTPTRFELHFKNVHGAWTTLADIATHPFYGGEIRVFETTYVMEEPAREFRFVFLEVPGRWYGAEFVVLSSVKFFGHLPEPVTYQQPLYNSGIKVSACSNIFTHLISRILR